MALILSAARRLWDEEDEEDSVPQPKAVTSLKPVSPKSLPTPKAMPFDQAKTLFETEDVKEPSRVGGAIKSVGKGAAAVATAIGKAGLRTGAQVSRGVASIMEGMPFGDQIFDPEAMDYFQDTLQDQADKQFGLSERTQTAIKEGRRFKDPLAIAEQSTEVLAQLGLIIGSGGTGLATVLASEAGNAREDAERRMISSGVDATTARNKANAEGALVGLVSYAMNKLTLGQFKPTKAVMEKVQSTLASKVLARTVSGAKAAGSEALEEVATGTVQDVARWVIENDKDAFKDFLSDRAAEAFFGAIGGGAAKAISIGAAKATAVSGKSYDEVVNRVSELESTDEGRELLRAYSQKESPTRADLATLGIKARLNAADRIKLAVAADPEMLNSAKYFIAKEAGVEETEIAQRKESEELPPVTQAPETVAQMNAAAEVTDAYKAPVAPQIAPPILSEEGGFLNLGQLVGQVQSNLDTMLPSKFKRGLTEVKRATIGLDPTGRRTRALTDIDVQSKANVAARQLDLSHAVRNLHSVVAKHTGVNISDGMPVKLSRQLNDYLQGKIPPNSIPTPILAATNDLGDIIDANSRELLNSGAVTGHMAAYKVDQNGETVWDRFRRHINTYQFDRTKIVDTLERNGIKDPKTRHLAASLLLNEGTYLNRAFEAFYNKDWAEKVSVPVRRKFHKWVADQYPQMTPDDIELKTNNLLDAAAEAGDLETLWNDGRFLKLSTNIMKQRLDLPKPWLDILGEKKDVTENFVRTAYKQIEFVEKYRKAQDLRSMGMGKFFWTKETRPNNEVVPLEVKGGMTPLKNLYTTPEIRELIQSLDDKEWYQKLGLVGKSYIWLEGFVQRNQTIRNPTAHARQMLGNPLMLVRNGNMTAMFDPKNLQESFDIIRQIVSPELQVHNVDKLKRLTELKIIDNSVDLRSLKESAKFDDIETFLTQLNLGKRRNIKTAKDLFVKAPQRVYQAEDTFFKILNWQAEINNYRKAMPNATEEELEELAADITVRTMPSWSNLPPVAQAARNWPYVGAFLTFPMSIWQTSINTFRQAASEAANPNFQIQMIGAKRFVGIAAAGVAADATIKAISALWGWTEEELQALRDLGAPWERFASLAGLSRTSDQITFENFSYIDPHSAILEATRQFMDGVEQEGILQGLGHSAADAFMGIFRNKMSIDAVTNVMENDNGWGKEIWSKNDDWITKAKRIGLFLGENLVLPAGAKRLVRYTAGMQGKETKAGPIQPFDEALQLWGVKQQTLIPRNQLFFALRDYDKSLTTIDSFFSELRRGGYIPESEIKTTLERASTNRKNALAEVSRKYKAATVLQPELSGNLRSVGGSLEISDKEYDAILTGRPGFEIPQSIQVIDRILPVIDDPQWKEELLGERDNQIKKLVSTSVSTPGDENVDRIRAAKTQLAQLNIHPSDRLKHYIESKTESDIKRRMTDIQTGIREKRLKAGQQPIQLDPQVLRQEAVAYVNKKKQEGSWMTKAKKRDIARIGFTRDQLSRMGYTEEMLLEYLPSSGVPGGDQ